MGGEEKSNTIRIHDSMTGVPNRIELAVAVLRPGRLCPRRAIGQLPEHCSPVNADDAMKLQDALNERLSSDGLGEVVGTKIGCTTKRSGFCSPSS